MHNSITVQETRENIHLFCKYTIFLRAFLLKFNPQGPETDMCISTRKLGIYQSRFFNHFLKKRIMLYIFSLTNSVFLSMDIKYIANSDLKLFTNQLPVLVICRR